jgi:hypothetical protein
MRGVKRPLGWWPRGEGRGAAGGCQGQPGLQGYPIQKVTGIYKKVTEAYKKVTEIEISSWNVLSLLRSEVAYIGTGHVLP